MVRAVDREGVRYPLPASRELVTREGRGSYCDRATAGLLGEDGVARRYRG